MEEEIWVASSCGGGTATKATLSKAKTADDRGLIRFEQDECENSLRNAEKG